MKYLNWIAAIFNSQRSMSMLNMFTKRKQNKRSTMWYSIIGIIASVVFTAYKVNKGKKKDEVLDPIQRIADSVQNSFQGAKAKPLQATFNEFANEITPNQPNNQSKGNSNNNMQ